MYGRSPERRRRQKLAHLSTFRVENEQNPEEMPQYFQISVNILEARKLEWSHPHLTNSYVVVIFGKKKYRTNIRRNMTDPYFNECFVFETFTSIQDLQRSSLWLAVMEPRCCASSRLLGEASIEMGTIWMQPRHQVFHKWALLTLARDPAAGPLGFLKVDISIIFRGELQIMPAIISAEKPDENNLLLPTGSEQQRANYVIAIFGAFGLPSGSHGYGDRRYGKPPSTFVKVSFCGLVIKTGVQHKSNNPMYCEQISIVEMFPNICQTIRLDVCSSDGCLHRVIASTHLKLGLVSHDGENGFLPTFGPSLLHMYGAGPFGATSEDGPYHRGALLVSLKTIVPYYQQDCRSTNVEPVTQMKPDQIWIMDDFWIYCPIMEVSMLDYSIAGKCSGIALTVGEVNTDIISDQDFASLTAELKSHKLHYTGSVNVRSSDPSYGYLEFQNGYPVLQVALRLPDFRFRMYRSNMVNGIVTDLESSVKNVEQRLKTQEYKTPNELVDELNKAVDDAAEKIVKFLDIVQYSKTNDSDTVMHHNMTELDQNQLSLQKEEMEKIYKQTLRRHKSRSTLSLIHTVTYGDVPCDTKKGVKLLLAEIKIISQNLRNLIFKSSEGWPDLVLWLLRDGSRVAYARIPAADVIHSVIPEQSGQYCGAIQSLFVKPTKCPIHINSYDSDCFCIAGKIELFVWMGLYRKKSCFESFLPVGMKLRVRGHELTMKSKVLMLDCRMFVYRAKLNNITDNGANHSYIFLRMNILNSTKETKKIQKSASPVWNQILKINTMVFSSLERMINSPPIMMVELYEIDYTVSEKLIKTTSYLNIDENFISSEIKDNDTNGLDMEPLPSNLIPQSSTYKVDVYWWGLRDMNLIRRPCVVLEIDELTIKSDVITENQVNCNFSNGKSSHVFEAPLNHTCTSPLSVRLYDSGTFGRARFIGTNEEKHPKKYTVSWIAQSERELSLKSASIMSSDFCQVTPVIYKKKKDDRHGDFSAANRTRLRHINHKHRAKRSAWARLFNSRGPTEEEYVLLPMFEKEKDHYRVIKKVTKSLDQKDWWFRYFNSIKDGNIVENKSNNVDKIVVYDTELENQAEFSKFKDWCTSLKLYNGKKTGIPSKDERLYCGVLKVGIAIYKWPPPEDVIAVTPSGINLNNGYFDDFPNNDPAQYLVRVYVVKGTDLKKIDFTGQSDPYVILSCGKKILGDRNNFVKNNVNPVFGRLYEFRSKLPEDYMLTISLYDFDPIQADALIGSTSIDLEDRIYTKHRARVGISSEYNLRGPYEWRDCYKPSEILEEICEKNHLPPPIYLECGTIIVNGVEYKDSDRDKIYVSASERKENICLTLLHQWHTLPVCGYRLVPEHLETRTLYNPEKPGYEHGKIQMWVDIFPLDTELYVPPPIDITPRKAVSYELRLIIWGVQKLKLEDSIASKKYPDIFVRAWIGSTSQAQDTDIHCRCTNGEGSFNWRMIFDFQYQHVERKIVVKEKDTFTEYKEKVPPILVVQVLDTEAVADDFIGTVILNLNALPRGDKFPSQCNLEAVAKAKIVNLFTMRSMRGWWPLWTIDTDIERKLLAGVIDMEITLLPKEKASLMPVGLGRSSPIALPEPQRPCTTSIFMKFKTEELYRYRVFKILFITLLLVLLSISVICIDMFSPMEADEWISDDPVSKHDQFKMGTIRPIN
ncbi:hypothetical protein evm_003115 [Chilo suppressalis]|nr:hypothetical protein evm_003115 [Chilo suppressalis]